MRSTDPGPGAGPRLRSLLFLVSLGSACVVGVLVASSWLEAWREREREVRIRRAHTIEGTVDEHPDFRSALLGNTRPVAVFLPRQYPVEPERRFPVLYVQDGQNVFDGATADVAGEEWQLDEAAERLIVEGRIEPLIVVGIGTNAALRRAEYTPARGPGDEKGGTEAYGRMLVEELKPWIDRSYRTRPGRESTGIAGSSLGGAASLYVGLRHTAVFSRIASLSTAAHGDDGSIERFVDALPAKPETLLWIDVGADEAPPSLAYARRIREALVRKGWREGADLRYLEAEGARDDVRSWARRLPELLSFLYPPGAGPVSSRAPVSR